MPVARVAHPFLFLRHGRTAWNHARRPQGQLDTALDATGRDQARAAANRLKRERIDRVVASPLARVRDTAEPIAAAHWLEVDYDEGLKECGLGAGEGADHGPWLKAYWAGAATPEGGEPFEVFAARAQAALARAAARPNALIVAHGGVWRALLAAVSVRPKFWMENAVPVRVTPRAAEPWRVEPLEPWSVAASDGQAV